MNKKHLVLTLFSALLITQVALAKRITIEFWNAMGGKQAAVLNHMIQGFNHSQKQYRVVSIFKGDYNALLTALVAAYRAHQQPAIAQIFEIGTATMLAAKGATISVQRLMQTYGYPQFSTRLFLPAIGDYYANTKGKLMALPFNASSPVLYYNKNAFKKAGLNPNKPPSTWPEMVRDGQKLLNAGFRCAFTTAWPDWIQIEVFSAWHNIPFATEQNGFTGRHPRVVYNNPLVIKQIQALAQWQKRGLFIYGGRGDNATSLFTSQTCPMMMQSSGARGNLVSSVKFPIGVGKLPYWPSVKGAPQNTSIGGGALWVMNGLSQKTYRGVAEFFHYLISPKVQFYWQKNTGYLPLTKEDYAYAKKIGYYAHTPGAIVAIQSLLNKPVTPYSRGIRLGDFMQIRDINENALESVFSGQMTAKQALDQATLQSNALLKRFSEMVSAE